MDREIDKQLDGYKLNREIKARASQSLTEMDGETVRWRDGER